MPIDEGQNEIRKRKASEQQHAKRRRFLAHRNKVRDLSREEAYDLVQLSMTLGTKISNENKKEFIFLGLAKEALGGTMLTPLGEIVLTKYKK